MKKIESIKGPFIPKDRIEYAAGSIVSQQLTYNQAGNITLFSFDEGQQLSEHTAPFDAVCQILEGTAEIHVGGEAYEVGENQMLIMPANVPHALYAKSAFKMLLIMIKG
ncbi:cupin domain-containing protein [uncultured Parabacteroides sp.]|uniref:cupin domain-containing protein n=1 Tax=uncultured Parabacteroides sp. TaxID=512312 RepID=UPI00262A787D|nr:cupin domain-containing protein [uncultured Parabacteroides sp.]